MADDGVTITFELRLKPEFAEAFIKSADMKMAASFPGFRSIRLVQHKDDPARILFIERWDDEASYKAYVDHRAQRGEMDALKQISVSAETNVWPNMLVEA